MSILLRFTFYSGFYISNSSCTLLLCFFVFFLCLYLASNSGSLIQACRLRGLSQFNPLRIA